MALETPTRDPRQKLCQCISVETPMDSYPDRDPVLENQIETPAEDPS
jgi:hypothetical protein